MNQKRFLAIGECMLEMSEINAPDYRLGFAGDTLNTAWYTRAMLPQDWQISYFTRVGTDPYSQKMLEFLQANGIDTAFISTDPVRQPGLYFINIKDGERTFTYWRDNSAARGLADDPVQLAQAIRTARVVYMSGITLAILAPERRDALLNALAQARAAGVITVFDPNIRLKLWPDTDTARREIMRAAEVCTIVLPSFEDEAALFGDASLVDCAARYQNAGCDIIVVKNGGGEILARRSSQDDITMKPEKLAPVDTTGAGDSFNAGFLAAFSQGQMLDAAIRYGHALSSHVIMHKGALLPMKILADIRACL